MELEEIYNDLYNYWNALPEPKVNWEMAFYGGIKDTIEKRLTYPLIEKPEIDEKNTKSNASILGDEETFNNGEGWEAPMMEGK